jgi:hypothetical protein
MPIKYAEMKCEAAREGTIGWVDFCLFCIFNTSTTEICCKSFKSRENDKRDFLLFRNNALQYGFKTYS